LECIVMCEGIMIFCTNKKAHHGNTKTGSV
jgi:hypothetical protein